MSTYEKKKGGSSIVGIILGILGAIAGFILPFIGGVIGGAIAGILGLVAILLGIKAMKNGKSRAALMTGVIAIILAVVVTVMSVGMFTKIRDEAKTRDDVPLVAEFASQPYLGLLGIAMNVPQDEETQKQFTEQLDVMIKEISEKTGK